MTLTSRFTAIILMTVSVMVLQGCSRAHSNMQTLNTSDCGVNWKLIQPGQTVPANIGPCDYRVTVPDYPMQGDLVFKSSFKARVLARIEMAYDYSITDALSFIKEAKFIGSKSAVDSNSDALAKLYEMAENSVIDKRIREVAGDLLLKEDIVEFNQGEFEDRLLAEVNKALKSRGVQLNFITVVPVPEEQTRLAIDMMTAMQVYKLRGMEDLGARVAIAKAGAARITTTIDAVPDKAEKK
jgi:hypothetical protein